jgi:molybdopterin adenylyltransferase
MEFPMGQTPVKIGILTVSDRASRGDYPDLSGPAVVSFLQQALAGEWAPVTRLVPDEQAQIERELRELCDHQGCCLVITTGGTGPSPRDVTPEATSAVCDRLLPGFGEQMRAASFPAVPTAILSRQLAGSRGQTLIINLPGKPRAVAECLQVVMPVIPDCITLLGGPRLTRTAGD